LTPPVHFYLDRTACSCLCYERKSSREVRKQHGELGF